MLYIANELIKYTTSQLWDTLPAGKCQLQFDDNVIIDTNQKEILYSSYFWDFHRLHPQLPVLSTHHVAYVLKGKMLNSETHMRLLEIIYWDLVAQYQLMTSDKRKSITKLIYDITNNIYNDLTQRLEAYVVSIDVLDFINVIEHPPIKEKLDNLEPTNASIKDTYDVIIKQLNESPQLDNNALAVATRAKIVNSNQVLQCVGPRGYVTEVDGYIMPVPILRSFTKGMRSLYNIILESRSAAKSLFFSETPLQDTDYFARRLQLITTAVERLHFVDCGSTDYLVWRIRGEERLGDVIVYPGDLKFIVGKYYLDETTNTLKVIESTDKHLVGTTIKMRTVLGCKHHDKHGVCAVCFGTLSKNISPYANIGHVCSATMTYQTMQSVLSTKHLDASSSSESIILTELAKRFLRIGNKYDTYFINTEWRNKPIQMVVSQDEAYGLTDILLVDNVIDISPTRVSGIEIVEFIVGTEQDHERHPISVSHHGRRAMISNEFLQHLKLHGWQNDDRGNFVFDFDKWDFTKPIMNIPQKEYSYAKHASEISKIIESRIRDITSRAKPDSPKSTLVELFELVNSKLNVNIACLEVILYAIMCNDCGNELLGLSHTSPNPGLGITSMIIRGRSLAAAYAYEGQDDIINDPKSFFKFDRTDTIFDVFINPYEVVKHYNGPGV